VNRAALAAFLAGATFAAASSAAADTIVLKNGRRIVASNVVDDGLHVSYDTPAGQMTIPKSIVARIERDSFAYTSSAVTQPPISAPQIEPVRGYEDVEKLAVHDGSVDVAYIARLEMEARGNSRAAAEKVAAAHYAASQYLLAKGDTDAAIDHYRRALTFSPDSLGLLLNLSALYLRESQFSKALDPLEHARRVAPDSPDVAKLMGWAYYGANKMDLAVQEWTRSEKLRADPEVEAALAKAQRDKSEEESYREGETAHFSLKYNGVATPDLARGILHALEDDYNDLESQLDYTPREPVAVILYTNQAFADITRAPSWAGALNDGRIRIPVQGLSSVTPELARELRHELTHSFVGQKSLNRAPTWVQEGVAQWMEGRRSSQSAGELLNVLSRPDAPHLSQLEGSWMGLSGDSAFFAYAWSLAVVESIVQAGGISDVSRLVEHLATASSTEEALRESLHSSYDDIEHQTLVYLRHEYVR
jgi:tetratricopeptide (TPR) repeat protein